MRSYKETIYKYVSVGKLVPEMAEWIADNASIRELNPRGPRRRGERSVELIIKTRDWMTVIDFIKRNNQAEI